MAPDKKDNKRKAAIAAADSPAKKTKKSGAKPSQTPKEASKSTIKNTKEPAAPVEDKPTSKAKANGQPTRQVKPRKRAVDFLSDSESGGEGEAGASESKAHTESKASNKKSKKEDGTSAPVTKEKISKSAKSASAQPAKKAEAREEDSDDSGLADPGAGESDEEEDDHTAALIRGFESSGDEDGSEDEGYDPSQPVPKIPDSKKMKRKLLKKQKEEKSENTEEPGTVYIGRIPHGFYEHQMRAYFSQFGEITRLRLSRNRNTGRSKHYAFVEFASSSVAKIVAGTMDNYLMYGHILKCKYVPNEQLHPDIWKGANRRFKITPWNRIEKKRLDKGKTREQWSDRIDREQNRRLAKVEKLKEIGYDFNLPQLKSVDDVPVQEKPNAIEEGSQEEPAKAIEAPPAEEDKKENDTSKKSKKEKKGSQPLAEQETPKQEEKSSKNGADEGTPTSASKVGSKGKKGGKGKSKAKA